MASKRTFDGEIKVPANNSSGITWNASTEASLKRKFSNAQAVVDNDCLRFMNPLTPMRTGAMIQSATIGTVIGSGEIVYNSPYARRQYYNNQGGSPAHPQAKGYWFETMKASHKDDILRDAQEALKDG